MKIRYACVLGTALAALLVAPANAAETVFSNNGSAKTCYLAAENGWNATTYLRICNQALIEAMSQRDRAATFVNRGILKLSVLDGKGSLDDFNRGLALNNDMGEGYVDRGASLILLKRYGEAINDISKGLALGAKRPQIAYYDRGIAHEGVGNIQAAYEDYKQAQALDPEFLLPTEELKRFKVLSKPGT